MKWLLTTALLLCLVPPVGGQSVKLPPEVKVPLNNFGIIPAETDCAELQWVSMTPGLSVIPSSLLKDSKTAVVMAPVGRYQLLAYGAKGDKASPPATCWVIVGDAPPVPPPPVDPVDPPKPPPDSTLLAGLKTAYENDRISRGGNMEQVRKLLQAYQAGATGARDPQFIIYRDFYSRHALNCKETVGDVDDVLPHVREFLSVELNKLLPMDPSKQLAAADRKLIEEKFTMVASLLAKLEKGASRGY